MIPAESEPARFEPDYYRRNFLLLIHTVNSIYDDLLIPQETAFIQTFSSCSPDAQCLYTRLLSRVGPVFRGDKVSYEEIADIDAAAQELEQRNLMVTNGDYELQLILELMLKDELKAFVANPAQKKKAELIEEIISSTEAGDVHTYRKTLFTTFELLGNETVTLLKLLFFGNFYQKLSEFIITDMGIIKYEDYPLDKSVRAFADRLSIDNLIYLHSISETLHETLPELDADAIAQIVGELKTQIPDPEHNRQVQRRFGRICNTLARQIERVGDGRTATEIYKLTSLPPSRERQVRILFSDSSYDEASELCGRILADPLNEEEHDFALTFSHRIEKKGNPAAVAPISLDIPTQHHDLVNKVPDSVEEYSLLGFMENGNNGYYTENTLWGGLFALAFWDIIFLPVAGVFYNPFQSAPADIFTEEFYPKDGLMR